MDNEEKKQLRKKDLITSVVLFILGVFIIIGATTMPISSSYGGVQNVWYVSPALFPFIIGGALIILSFFLAKTAIQAVGTRFVKEKMKSLEETGIMEVLLRERNLRYIAILSFFMFYVYLFIPQIDYFLCTFQFLLVFISIFYFNDNNLLKKLLKFYLIGSFLFLGYFIFNLDGLFGSIFTYFSDILFIIFIIAYIIYVKISIKKKEFKLKFNISLYVSFLVPLIIVPVFKYFLLVVLPTEGLVVELVNYLVYDVLGLM